jgi:NADH-quinone oxidoreductase subunit J
MNVGDLLFYLFAAFTLVCGLLVIANPFSRSPVTSAMFLVLTLVALSGLFILLHAFFLAAVQILVYAGAVMVLFLFVIMMLDLPEEERRRVSWTAVVTGLLAVGGMAMVLLSAVAGSFAAPGPDPVLEANAAEIGHSLFTQYLLPFELLSVLLLVAMLGVILLSKKEIK